jgi:phosphomannomutase/phosphoglucomutase
MFNPSIFRSYDIRGVYGKDFDEDFAKVLGKTFANFISQGQKCEVVVGRDVRLSSESLHNALIDGLSSAGCDVVDIGVVTTPALYFAVSKMGKSGGIMITASHNPAEFNGFKLVGKMAEPIAEGSGLEKIKDAVLRKTYKDSTRKGEVRKYDNIFEDYASFTLGKINLKKRLRVVLDTCNSVAGIFAPKLFEKAGCEVITINEELDGRFPSRSPEPKAEHLEALRKAVKANGADLGVAYDGDGDRAVFVDEEGNVIESGNPIIMIFAEHYLGKKKRPKIVFDLSCSIAVEDTIRRMGGIPVMTAVGISNIKKGMLKEDAVFGGESSNHMYFSDMFNSDDGVFASLKMAEIVSEVGSLSEKVKSMPHYPYLSEWEFTCPDERKFEVVERLKEKFRKSEFRISELDGLKLVMDDGWVLWRVSNTRPQIKIYVEAKSDERFEELKNFARDELVKMMGD